MGGTQGNSYLKLPFNQLLGQVTAHQIDSEFATHGGIIAGRIQAIRGQILDVSPLVEELTNTIECGIASSPFVKLPLRIGDGGYIIPSVFWGGAVTGIGDEVSGSLSKLSNFCSCLFLPATFVTETSGKQAHLTIQGRKDADGLELDNRPDKESSINLTKDGITETTKGSINLSSDKEAYLSGNKISLSGAVTSKDEITAPMLSATDAFTGEISYMKAPLSYGTITVKNGIIVEAT